MFAKNLVATSQPLAAEAGLEALRKGGNAMDAALTTAICLTVVEPTSNGIGSDAFAIVWDGSELHGFNGSGRSPAEWDVSRFSSGIPARGWDPVTVPGAVDTWVQCSRRFGRMPFSELFDAAVSYAEDGFPVSPITARGWQRASESYAEFDEWRRVFTVDGRAPEVGDVVRLPDHAATLRAIAESEGEAFYRGEIAQLIEADARRHGAAMTVRDLSDHQGEWVETLHTGFHGVDLHEIPPNTQGLAALLALGIMRHTPVLECALDSADFYHLQIEAMKIALNDVYDHVSDPRTMLVAADELLDDGRLAHLASGIDPRRAAERGEFLQATPSTVYLCAADDAGMMVSFIQSNYTGFGSGIVVPGTGIAMQNRGLGFVTTPGHPNQAAPGKRPFHTIIPGFVTRGSQAHMAFGVMGGPMQAQGHLQMVTRVCGFEQNPQEASDAPRWQVTQGGGVSLEAGFDDGVAGVLRDRGHRVVVGQDAVLFGGAQAILRFGEAYCAASDHRKDGCAIGF